MSQTFTLNVNQKTTQVEADPETPLLYILRNDLGLSGPKFGCGLEQCNACKVLIDGRDVPSCQIPIHQVAGLEITTIEGLGTAESPHPLQEVFVEEQAIQCGYCASGMIIAAQGLLNRTRYPTDQQIRDALSDNICRCGVYERVRRAIKMRIGRPEWDPIYELIDQPPLTDSNPTDDRLPASIQQTPDLDHWIQINSVPSTGSGQATGLEQATITVYSGKVEIGQGIKTALAQIAAEELDVNLDRIRVISGDTAQSPNEGITAGSMSLQTSGVAIRVAAAEARQHLLNLAFEELEAQTPATELLVEDGTITDPATGSQTTYWHLLGGKKFGRQIAGIGRPKSPKTYSTVGQPATRLDLLQKVTGAPCFVHDLTLPNMVHGRVVRPPAYDARLVSVDDSAVRQMPGVLQIVRDGRFLAILAEREEQAIWAAEALAEKAVWQNDTDFPQMEGLFDHLMSQPSEDSLILNGTAVSDPIPPIETPPNAAQTLNAAYYRPYHMHGSLGPSAAVAQLVDGKLTIWSHSQGVPLLQHTIAQVLEMDPADIHLIHTEGAGCYGHNGADDAALDAALLARAMPGRPISLKWSREDEHTWEPYGTAMAVKMQASLDQDGRLLDWNHDVWSYPHTARPRPGGPTSGFPTAQYLSKPFQKPQPRPIQGYHFGDYRNADPLYTFPKRRIVTHFVPNSPLRTSSLRSLGAYANIFAIESFMDELARAAGTGPVTFRLQNLADERAKAVITTAVEKAGWEPKSQPAANGTGTGIAFAQYKNIQAYAAIVVTVEVDLENGRIQLKKATIAADAGQIVNPDGLSNQLEGGFFQAASWTLAEQVTFGTNSVTSRDWDSYPILRFSGSPEIQTVLLNRPNHPFLGSGEATTGPTPAAIANAIFDATSVRLRQLPLTAEKLRQKMNQT